MPEELLRRATSAEFAEVMAEYRLQEQERKATEPKPEKRYTNGGGRRRR